MLSVGCCKVEFGSLPPPTFSPTPSLFPFCLLLWDDYNRKSSPGVGALGLDFAASTTIKKSLFLVDYQASRTLLQWHRDERRILWVSQNE